MSMVAVLEAQLKEMQEERQIASRVLLNCSRELSQNQALVAQKLGSIEADMMALESEEKDLSARLEAGQAEEKLLRDELERLWEEERELDTKENVCHLIYFSSYTSKHALSFPSSFTSVAIANACLKACCRRDGCSGSSLVSCGVPEAS